MAQEIYQFWNQIKDNSDGVPLTDGDYGVTHSGDASGHPIFEFDGVINGTTPHDGGVSWMGLVYYFQGFTSVGNPVFSANSGGANATYVFSNTNLIGQTVTFANGGPYNYCFVGGTLIATPDGECLVENLQIGDRIKTADGRDVPVKWVGRQIVRTPAFLTADENRAPVCIQAGALGNHSDLYVSADHGMVVDGLVINASALVNGDTIRFVAASEMPAEFTYYHIETEAHDVILANGAASETFIDVTGRAAFDNHQEYLSLYGVERIIPEMPALRISSQRLVPHSIKQRLGISERAHGLRRIAV